MSQSWLQKGEEIFIVNKVSLAETCQTDCRHTRIMYSFEISLQTSNQCVQNISLMILEIILISSSWAWAIIKFESYTYPPIHPPSHPGISSLSLTGTVLKSILAFTNLSKMKISEKIQARILNLPKPWPRC